MELHAWKRDWLKRIRAAEGNVLAVGPTGCGKTVIAAHLMRKGRVLFIAHTRELVEQAIKRCAEWGVTGVEVLRPGEPMPKSRVIIASKQTLERRQFPKVELVIFDEAHHLPSAGWARIHEHYRKSGAKIYGLTATPIRLDGKPMSDFFDSLVQAPLTSELAMYGHIAIPRVWAPKEGRPNLSNVKISGRDFESRSVAEVLSKRKIVGAVVDHWRERAGDLQTVVYAVSVDHAWSLAREFGDCSAVIQGAMRTEDRDEILGLFRSGELRVLINCQILTEGWDCPSAKCVVLARPTLSFGLLMQMVGRISRPNGAKPLVLDLVDNFRYFDSIGLNPLGDIEYSLEQEPQETGRKAGGKRALRTCPECECLCSKGTRVCECGHEFWQRGEPEIEQGELELWFPSRGLTNEQIEMAIKLYGERKSSIEIGKILGVSKDYVNSTLKRNGVKIRSNAEAKGGLTPEQTRKAIKLYGEGKSYPEIARMLGVGPDCVRGCLKRNGVKIRTLLEAHGGLTPEQASKATKLYRKNKSCIEIAEILGASKNCVISGLKRNGVKMRTLSEVQMLAARKRRHA